MAKHWKEPSRSDSQDAFENHLKQANHMVSSWPSWMQTVLGEREYMPKPELKENIRSGGGIAVHKSLGKNS
ncbi:MAG: hypothetical protein NTX50_29955 [Candidatus Sumerlaeota bacterium]|nr:hypothetical protein [Candidatus Sumerlaeota bacterium]